VTSLPIVVTFDIGEQVAPCGITIGVLAVANELGFQSAEEAKKVSIRRVPRFIDYRSRQRG
jgi:hypothetical protein